LAHFPTLSEKVQTKSGVVLIADCQLPIADCQLLISPIASRESTIGNPQSAIRNPQSAIKSPIRYHVVAPISLPSARFAELNLSVT